MNRFLFSLLTVCVLASPALSQSTSDTSATNDPQPVEATADNLQVNQDENSAVFSGSAKVVQGALNLQADKITVFFGESGGNIKSVVAVGQVAFTNGQETASGEVAEFNVVTQTITFTGNVVLRQAQTVLTGNKLTYNIATGYSKMTGNVKTVFIPN